MNQKAIQKLEFDKIRKMLAESAVSDLGVKYCLTLMPSSNMEEVIKMQQETEEAVYILKYKGRSPITSFEDVRDYLSLAQKGSVLSAKVLLQFAGVLCASRTARNSFDLEGEFTKLLASYAMQLRVFKTLENDISESILSEDSIADNASSTLFDIRRQIRLLNERMRSKLDAMVISHAKYLQDPIVTIRNGRYCLPVKQEYRKNVNGIVHDQSSTGATLFIEPLMLVEGGNELKQLSVKEQQEIERILAGFSSQAAEIADEVATNIAVLQHLDVIFAKGKMALDMQAVRPKINKQRYFNFINVRHPLLPKETVVPCSIWLGEDFSTLVITGPNTGGKTVTLKTVGLISIMAQAGLHVPAAQGTSVYVFQEIFADIGDEQSIEQSLSTFSSHMTNIVNILRDVEEDSLVLLDELGAGTDPAEGSALARSILSYLTERKILSVATTHFSELKAFALSTEGVENASVEFDVESLRPTYKLSIGMPGKSNAFEISKKLGLPNIFIERAKEHLSVEDAKFEDVIASAEHHRQVAERERQKAQELYKEAQETKAQADKILLKAQEKYKAATDKAKSDAKQIVNKAKRESAGIIQELKNIKASGNIPWHEIDEQGKRFASLEDMLNPDIEISNKAPLDKDKLNVGDRVKLAGFNTDAILLSLPDKSDKVQVQVGSVKMYVNFDKLSKTNKEYKKPKTTVTKKISSAGPVSLSCDVRGLSLEEAILETDRYLDDSLLKGFKEVSIVHGKGSGVLRAGLQEHLKKLKYVDKFRLGRYGEGEDGVTIVTLK
ncbi:MAG: endonuclease MutS2 [Eubacteriales bacterium]|nr:endonuclease MutS2 [Eubacteriales bacterium]